MKAVVSGSHGFIGTHLCRALSLRGEKVVPLTRELLYAPDRLREFFAMERPDYIFHVAAYGNMASQKDESLVFAANLTANFNMLYESRTVPYRAFVNFGTSSEYGRKAVPMAEHQVLEPETIYAATKAGATHLAAAFAAQFNKPILTVRPFSVYGPGEAACRFIPTAIRSMLTGQPFPLDAHANHDWIYVEDLTTAVLLLADRALHLSPDQRVFNVGSGRMSTNKEVCEMLREVSGLDYNASPSAGLRCHDSAVWVADNTRIAALGFKPGHTLADGLAKTFRYYQSLHEAES